MKDMTVGSVSGLFKFNNIAWGYSKDYLITFFTKEITRRNYLSGANVIKRIKNK